MNDDKPNWPALIMAAIALYLFLWYAPERHKTGYYRGLCEAGQGGGDEAAERCQEIHP
jgi:hypothetical protein